VRFKQRFRPSAGVFVYGLPARIQSRAIIWGYITTMVTKRTARLMHLDPDKAKLLDQLAAETRILRSVFIREAIDDLLMKYGKVKWPRRKT
jgi:hypothetical protein